MREKIIKFVRRKIKEANAKGVVIGLSGGVDSTTTLFLCVQSLGNDRILGVIMPSKINKKQDTDDAVEICNELDVEYKIIEINPILESFRNMLNLSDKKVAGNLMARIRMCILYYFANKEKLLVVGTGNKSEFLQGYFTLHGDVACDLLPLGNLYKTEVKKLAEELDVPRRIIEKTPSAGLWIGQTDEGELGVSYKNLDRILPLLEKELSVEKIHQKTNVEKEKIKIVKDRMKRTEFKRKPINKSD